MSRLRGLMKMLSGVLTPVGAVFVLLAGIVLLALLILFSTRVPIFLPVLVVLMALLWKWVARFSDQEK